MSKYEFTNSAGISSSNPSHMGGLQLRNVYFLEGEDLNLVRGVLFVSRETGEIQILSGTPHPRKHDRAGNPVVETIPDPSGCVGWQLNGGTDFEYLVVPALKNTIQVGYREELKEFFDEEEIAQGKLSNLQKTVSEILSQSVRQGVSNVTLEYVGSDPKEREVIEACLKVSGLRGAVTDAQTGNVFYRQQTTLGQDLIQIEDGKVVNIGTGNYKVANPDIWQEYQSLALHLLSKNKGQFPIKPEALLRNAFYGGGKYNLIKNGAFADLAIIKLEKSQMPFKGAKSLLLKGTPSVQGVIRRGKFLYLNEELNHQINATVVTKSNLGGCEFDSIEEALAEFAKGNFVVVVDNEDRENEGDLIMACEAVTEEKMAFLIRHTSGLVCISTTGKRLAELDLPLMVTANNESHKTAFTVSIDYIHGTTTGISAYDRALTSRAIANPQTTAADFNRPGHMFPLRYTEGGVMKRMGHTEATVDLCKMAGMYPAGILCEIALDNGQMARRDYLRSFATQYGLKMITIADMIAYRKKHGLLETF